MVFFKKYKKLTILFLIEKKVLKQTKDIEENVQIDYIFCFGLF